MAVAIDVRISPGSCGQPPEAGAAPPPPKRKQDSLRARCLFFFCEGQQLRGEAGTSRGKLWPPLLPAALVLVVWTSVMASHDLFYLFGSAENASGTPNYTVALMMVFGSLVAGATSEGGGAIAYPVMTLLLRIKPAVARDFSFMIQTVGMSSAALAIVLMRVHIEVTALLYGSLGGAAGLVFGLELVSPHLPPAFAKMYFVSVFLTFALALYLLNSRQNRRVFSELPAQQLRWRLLLLVAGFCGGVFTAIGGSGLDIAMFALLTIFFRVSEKVATPTSVVLMAVNTSVGFFYRAVVQKGISDDAWRFFAVASPVVCVGAPLGSFVSSHFHRLALAGLIYVLDTVQFAGALIVLRPWSTKSTDSPLLLCLSSAAILLGGAFFFWRLGVLGERAFLRPSAGQPQPQPQHDDGSDAKEDAEPELAPSA